MKYTARYKKVHTSVQIGEDIEDTDNRQNPAIKLNTLAAARNLCHCVQLYLLPDVSLLRDRNLNMLNAFLHIQVYRLSVLQMLGVRFLNGIHAGDC